MFGFFRRSGTLVPTYRGRAFLRLESLEWRDQPTELVPQPPVGIDGGNSRVQNLAPQIVNYTAEQTTNGLFVITGTVVDESPGGLTVTFGGDTVGSGQRVTTNADGSFSLILQLPLDGTGAGYLTATVTDAGGLVSQEVSVFLDPTIP
jgi:hypothetical protein